MEVDNSNKKVFDNLGCTQNMDTTKSVESIVRGIVKEKTADITGVINQIRAFLKDETTELTDLEIDDILLQLPILLYSSMEEQEIVGMQLDMASQIQKEAYQQAYKLAHGTIKDKDAEADIATRAQQLEKIIYDRSYKIIKQRFEMAVETLNAVKKVQASRQQRYDMGKYNNRF